MERERFVPFMYAGALLLVLKSSRLPTTPVGRDVLLEPWPTPTWCWSKGEVTWDSRRR